MGNTDDIIAIGSDHAGFGMKEYLKAKLREQGYIVYDFGAYSAEPVDYPDPIHLLASSVEKGMYKRGIILCGSGNGAAIVANKYPHVRAALCWNDEISRLARQHNDANIVSLPARFVTNLDAAGIVNIFLDTPFEGGRHARRVGKISILLQ